MCVFENCDLAFFLNYFHFIFFDVMASSSLSGISVGVGAGQVSLLKTTMSQLTYKSLNLVLFVKFSN